MMKRREALTLPAGGVRRVGKGALAPCPPPSIPAHRCMVGTSPDALRPLALPTLRFRRAPCAGVAACDQPVDDAGDDARAGHDFEMTPHDAVETERGGVERHHAEIA